MRALFDSFDPIYTIVGAYKIANNCNTREKIERKWYERFEEVFIMFYTEAHRAIEFSHCTIIFGTTKNVISSTCTTI